MVLVEEEEDCDSDFRDDEEDEDEEDEKVVEDITVKLNVGTAVVFELASRLPLVSSSLLFWSRSRLAASQSSSTGRQNSCAGSVVNASSCDFTEACGFPP
jgi:hypothetical protein